MIRGGKLAEFLYDGRSIGPTRKTESAVERSVNFHTKLRRRRGGRLLRPKEKRHIDTQREGIWVSDSDISHSR